MTLCWALCSHCLQLIYHKGGNSIPQGGFILHLQFEEYLQSHLKPVSTETRIFHKDLRRGVNENTAPYLLCALRTWAYLYFRKSRKWNSHGYYTGAEVMPDRFWVCFIFALFVMLMEVQYQLFTFSESFCTFIIETHWSKIQH